MNALGANSNAALDDEWQALIEGLLSAGDEA
jgi:hypothetical protein